MTKDLNEELDIYVQAILEKKAESIVALDVRGLTSIADAFIICSGRSSRQVSAIADQIQRFLKEHAIKPLSVEGKSDGHWVLMDYGDVVIHVFYVETRAFYDLEGLWIDAKRVTTPSMQQQQEANAQAFDGEETIVD